MFMTAALSINDMKGLALQMAMEIMHEDGGVDAITGLRTRTQPGRPKWRQVRVTFESRIFACTRPCFDFGMFYSF